MSAFPSQFALVRRGGAAAGLVVAAGALAVVPLSPVAADPAGTGLVINEVYGAGGNSGANLDADYVELFNPTDAAIPLAGLTLQYRSATGTGAANGVATLSGSVAPDSTYLIRTSTPGANGAALPEPDLQVSGVNMAAANGTVWLSTSATAVDLPTAAEGGLTERDDVIDLVGFGTSNTYEGTAAAPAPSTTTSIARTEATDTDDNSADLTVGTQTPTAGGGDDTPPGPDPDPELVTIQQIQGTGAATPLPASPVITRGVVTASYPSGGFAGFYLQTPGTGGEPKAASAGSDAVFVYLGSQEFPRIGDHVEVTGTPGEHYGLTQVNASSGSVRVLDEPAEAVKARAFTLPRTEAERERYEGELVAPSDGFTVTSNFNLNSYGEIALAQGTTPLLTPTEVADPADADAIAAVEADNTARSIALDDGASINFLSTSQPANRDIALPWITRDHSVRVNAAVEFTAPVVLDYRNDAWKFQPTSQLTADQAAPATFEDTRTQTPEDVGGDLQLATFNVLNYFTTTGEEWAAAESGRSCTYYTDRAGRAVTNNRCNPDGPRGAANQANLERQQSKVVAAINAIDAGVVSLEEIENSAAFGEDRDAALATLVEALNAAAGDERWAYVPSPDEVPADEDVIRTAFIYQPAQVRPVGSSAILLDDPAFANAREPLAQVFEAGDDEQFSVIVNHLKSKSDSSPPATGDNANGVQGAFNGDRTRQARSLATFAQDFAARAGTDAVFLTGDFNSYSQEDPVGVLEDAGYTNLVSDGEWTYSFQGRSGSLDHVFANAAAAELVTGSDIWEINAVEPISYEYSRYNYNATDFHAPNPYRSSDHEPHVVGIALSGDVQPPEPDSIGVDSTFRVGAPTHVVRVGGSKTFVVTYTGQDGRAVSGTTYVTIRQLGTSRLIARVWTYAGEPTRMTTPAFPRWGAWQISVTFVPAEEAYRSTTRTWWVGAVPTGRW